MKLFCAIYYILWFKITYNISLSLISVGLQIPVGEKRELDTKQTLLSCAPAQFTKCVKV